MCFLPSCNQRQTPILTSFLPLCNQSTQPVHSGQPSLFTDSKTLLCYLLWAAAPSIPGRYLSLGKCGLQVRGVLFYRSHKHGNLKLKYYVNHHTNYQNAMTLCFLLSLGQLLELLTGTICRSGVASVVYTFFLIQCFDNWFHCCGSLLRMRETCQLCLPAIIRILGISFSYAEDSSLAFHFRLEWESFLWPFSMSNLYAQEKLRRTLPVEQHFIVVSSCAVNLPELSLSSLFILLLPTVYPAPSLLFLPGHKIGF